MIALGLSGVKSELAVAVAIGTAQPALSGDMPAFVPWMSQQAMGDARRGRPAAVNGFRRSVCSSATGYPGLSPFPG
jgi:hypothetical protein